MSILGTVILSTGILMACLLVSLYIYFKKATRYWEKKNVPYLKPSFPFGNFTDSVLLRKSTADVFETLYNKLEGKKYGGTYMLTNPVLIVRDLELIKSILVKDFSHFYDRGIYVDEEKEPVMAHLVFMRGKKWRNLRTVITPAFTTARVKMMFQTMVECGNNLARLVENTTDKGQIIEIRDILGRYSTDIMTLSIFGIECNSLKNKNSDFRQWIKTIFEPSLTRLLIGILRQTVPQLIRRVYIPIIDKNVSEHFLDVVKETIEYREKNNVKQQDFLQLLIQLKNDGFVPKYQQQGCTSENIDKIKLSTTGVTAQAVSAFMVGSESPSSIMAFCLYELAINTDIQERVRQEISDVLEKHDGKMSYGCVKEMTYLDQVISEILRMYPTIPMLAREVTKEYTIPGTDIVLEKGTQIIIPIQGIHRDSKYYPNPAKFDPDRFSEEQKKKRHPQAFLPHGDGPRMCIGIRFGLMQTKVGLVSLLSKFKFDVSKKTSLPMKIDRKSFLVMKPDGGMWLQITKH